MLSRYKMYRGKRPAGDPLPRGIRQDTRWRTRHPLRPTQQLVERYLAAATDDAWAHYVKQYKALLDQRFRKDRRPFDDLATLATENDVYLGCSCPTRKNPNARHCHTALALQYMQAHYPELCVKP